MFVVAVLLLEDYAYLASLWNIIKRSRTRRLLCFLTVAITFPLITLKKGRAIKHFADNPSITPILSEQLNPIS